MYPHESLQIPKVRAINPSLQHLFEYLCECLTFASFMTDITRVAGLKHVQGKVKQYTLPKPTPFLFHHNPALVCFIWQTEMIHKNQICFYQPQLCPALFPNGSCDDWITIKIFDWKHFSFISHKDFHCQHVKLMTLANLNLSFDLAFPSSWSCSMPVLSNRPLQAWPTRKVLAHNCVH